MSVFLRVPKKKKRNKTRYRKNKCKTQQTEQNLQISPQIRRLVSKSQDNPVFCSVTWHAVSVCTLCNVCLEEQILYIRTLPLPPPPPFSFEFQAQNIIMILVVSCYIYIFIFHSGVIFVKPYRSQVLVTLVTVINIVLTSLPSQTDQTNS